MPALLIFAAGLVLGALLVLLRQTRGAWPPQSARVKASARRVARERESWLR